ncbi:hypothetical protein E2R55_10290 [Vibrio vulnificus]|nr:hypothetical protein E2R55_10290 [Vibrio vulnificus]
MMTKKIGISGLLIKKSPAKICRVLLCLTKDQKAKGEEKPEEELMGKRKPSPRLATTPKKECCYSHYCQKPLYYSPCKRFIKRMDIFYPWYEMICSFHHRNEAKWV